MQMRIEEESASNSEIFEKKMAELVQRLDKFRELSATMHERLEG